MENYKKKRRKKKKKKKRGKTKPSPASYAHEQVWDLEFSDALAQQRGHGVRQAELLVLVLDRHHALAKAGEWRERLGSEHGKEDGEKMGRREDEMKPIKNLQPTKKKRGKENKNKRNQTIACVIMTAYLRRINLNLI
jgi:hypothetical protein